MRRCFALVSILTMFAISSCSGAGEAEDGESEGFPSGKADGGIDEGSPEALGVLALVNDPDMTAAKLKSEAGVTTRVANNIVNHRMGDDEEDGTDDDDPFDTLAELDGVPYVGPTVLQKLLDLARDKGLVGEQGDANIDVVFSPATGDATHNARIAQLIRDAEHTVDIAIYSYSDAAIAAALKDAVERDVAVRFLFETARDDKSITDAAMRAASKSGRLEAMGVDVRYVNKILHHKFLIVDGPRDVRDRAETAKIVTGSANWSASAATQFDENTLFVQNSPEIAAAFQQEFDKLWVGSRDFEGPAGEQPDSTAGITTNDVADEAGTAVLVTSPNFRAGGSDGTTWTVDRDSTVVSDVWVEAIQNARTSIHIASGHMRLRPVAEALIAKKAANPNVDIKVYLDQQEFISASGHTAQVAEVEECLAAATTAAQERDCKANDFLFSRELVQGGIDVRFKSFAYRWNHAYAAQMHSKYMIVDGKELISGSYNLSMNAEQATFENALHLSGEQHAGLISRFEDNFGSIWGTGRGLLAGLRMTISTSSTIPLVFPSMALTYQEFESLRTLIRQNCTVADSPEYRSNPTAHRTCPR